MSRRPTAQSPQLLLVEDHVETRAAMSRLLSARGFHVLVAGTAEEAREVADKHHLDLVISDIGLPDESGFELMASLKEQHPQLPGIAMTAYGMEQDFFRSYASGFSAHLVKPVPFDRLAHAIADALAA